MPQCEMKTTEYESTWMAIPGIASPSVLLVMKESHLVPHDKAKIPPPRS